jgi:hypothetical protein
MKGPFAGSEPRVMRNFVITANTGITIAAISRHRI